MKQSQSPVEIPDSWPPQALVEKLHSELQNKEIILAENIEPAKKLIQQLLIKLYQLYPNSFERILNPEDLKSCHLYLHQSKTLMLCLTLKALPCSESDDKTEQYQATIYSNLLKNEINTLRTTHLINNKIKQLDENTRHLLSTNDLTKRLAAEERKLVLAQIKVLPQISAALISSLAKKILLEFGVVLDHELIKQRLILLKDLCPLLFKELFIDKKYQDLHLYLPRSNLLLLWLVTRFMPNADSFDQNRRVATKLFGQEIEKSVHRCWLVHKKSKVPPIPIPGNLKQHRRRSVSPTSPSEGSDSPSVSPRGSSRRNSFAGILRKRTRTPSGKKRKKRDRKLSMSPRTEAGRRTIKRKNNRKVRRSRAFSDNLPDTTVKHKTVAKPRQHHEPEATINACDPHTTSQDSKNNIEHAFAFWKKVTSDTSTNKSLERQSIRSRKQSTLVQKN